MLLNFADFQTISSFDVLDFNEFSDHAPINFKINVKLPQTQPHNTTNNETFINRKIIWDNSKTDLVHAQLVNSHEVIQRLISDKTPSRLITWYKILRASYMILHLMCLVKLRVVNPIKQNE